MSVPYDAFLLVSFGGPEQPDDVLPFLKNVTAGKNIPEERLREVAEHYAPFDGKSPINEENLALVRSLVGEFNAQGISLPVYWGNRHWHPFLVETLQQMADEGIRHALAFVTSAFASYAGCRQYLEAIEDARKQVGPEAPQVDKLRLFFNHPGFIQAMAQRVKTAWQQVPENRQQAARLVFSAHSLPVSMARNCAYESQLHEACRLVAEELGIERWDLAYQSRSGPPSQPWLEPELGDHLVTLANSGEIGDVVLAPIGFMAEHMETVYDLDVEMAELCETLGLHLVRAGTVGNHPLFVTMIRQLVEERLTPGTPRLALGSLGPSHDVCPPDCCRP